MKTRGRRICVTTNDIELVTGRSYRQSLRVLHEIAKSLNKATKFVTIREFCAYTGLDVEEVEATIFR